MTKNNAAQSSDNPRRDAPNLDSRYGQIGISAVAAALPYQSEVKNPAYAPAAQNVEKWSAEPRGARRHIPDAVGPHSAGLALACVTSSLSLQGEP